MAEYELASGQINVLEKKVFDRLDQERMLNAPDQKTAWQVLFDTDLTNFIEGENVLEKIFEADLNELKINLEKMLKQESGLLAFLFLKFDALNLKAALKTEFFPEKALSFTPFSQGIAGWPELAKLCQYLVKSRASPDLPDDFRPSKINPIVGEMAQSAVEQILKQGGKPGSAEIEQAVDRAYFQAKLKLSLREPGLLEQVKLEIDLANLKNILQLNGPSAGWLAGGGLNEKEAKALAGKQAGEVLAQLQKMLFGRSLKSLKLLDTAFQRFFSQKIMERARNQGMGVYKVLAYFQKKVNAQNNIRLILFAKERNLALSEIENSLLPI